MEALSLSRSQEGFFQGHKRVNTEMKPEAGKKLGKVKLQPLTFSKSKQQPSSQTSQTTSKFQPKSEGVTKRD